MKIGQKPHQGLMASVAAVVASMPASLRHPRQLRALVFAAIGLGLTLVLAFAQGAVAQQNLVTAIDIAAGPRAPMTTNSFAAVFGAWLSLGLGMSSFDAVDGSSTGT